MTDSDLLDDLVARLALLRMRAGSDVYRRALVAARTAVARVVLAEAERRAGVATRRGNVVRFTRGRSREPDEAD